jgi:hypothetical protein
LVVSTCSTVTLLKINKYLLSWRRLPCDIWKNWIVHNENWEKYLLPSPFPLHSCFHILPMTVFAKRFLMSKYKRRVCCYDYIWQNVNKFSNCVFLHFSFTYFGLHQNSVNRKLNTKIQGTYFAIRLKRLPFY